MKNKRAVLITILLFLYGAVTFGLFMSKYEPSPSILISEHQNPFPKNTPLLAGKKITFEIASPHDGLGIIAVRFQTYGRINDDVLSFRIKPKGASIWTYASNYKTDQFQDHELFPFGFPLEPFSEDGTYQIQLESLSGTESNHVSIDTINPVIVSKYHYPSTDRTPTTSMNIQFGFRKIFSLFTNSSTLFPIIVFFSPLMVFLINSYFSLAIPVILISLQYLLNLPRPYHFEITLLLAWLTYLLVTKASYRISVALSLFAAFYLLIQTLGKNPVGVDQAAIWLYYCLLLTVIQIKFNHFNRA